MGVAVCHDPATCRDLVETLNLNQRRLWTVNDSGDFRQFQRHDEVTLFRLAHVYEAKKRDHRRSAASASAGSSGSSSAPNAKGNSKSTAQPNAKSKDKGYPSRIGIIPPVPGTYTPGAVMTYFADPYAYNGRNFYGAVEARAPQGQGQGKGQGQRK